MFFRPAQVTVPSSFRDSLPPPLIVVLDSLGKPSKKINYEYRELVPTFLSPLCLVHVGKLIIGTVDQIQDPPPPSCGRDKLFVEFLPVLGKNILFLIYLVPFHQNLFYTLYLFLIPSKLVNIGLNCGKIMISCSLPQQELE